MLLLQQWYRIRLVILGQRLILVFPCLFSGAEELIVENATSSICASKIFSCFFVGRNLYFNDLTIIKIYTYVPFLSSKIKGRILLIHCHR